MAMDKKTRLLNCVDGKPIDKVPFTFWHHYSGEDAKGKQCVAAHKRLYDEVGVDFIKMMSDNFFPIDFGVDSIQTPSDWSRLHIPKMTDPYVRDQVDRILWMREAVKDECCVYYVLFSAVGFLRLAYSYDVVVQQLTDPEARKYLVPTLNNMGDFVAELGSVLLRDGGAQGIHMSVAGSHYFPRDLYVEYISPQDWKLMNAAAAVRDYNILHLCGNRCIQSDLSIMRDYKAAIIHCDQHTDKIFIPEIREYFQNKRAIMAGFDNRPNNLLYTASKQDLKAMVKEYAKSGGETGYILSGDCSLEPDIDYARLRWIGEALEELAQ